MDALLRIYDRFVKSLSKAAWLPPLLARLTLGFIFAQSGWGKINNIEQVIEFFQELNLQPPAFHAYLVAYTELIAGGLVFIGFLTRLACVPLAITMIVAIIKANLDSIQELSDLLGLSEYLYIVLFIWLFVEGPGKASVDWFLKRRRDPRR